MTQQATSGVELAGPGASTAAVPRLGRFRVVGRLGKGGMGVVYRAIDEKLKRHVALKVIPRDPAGRNTLRTEAFLREARSVAQLDHPHIVQIHEIGETEKHVFIAMELLEGGDLWQIFRATGPFDLPRLALIGAEAADALAHAHAAGVVHRDIKPANLMLTRLGRCKVTDFGLARTDDSNDPFDLPSIGVGTPFYFPPEVLLRQPAVPASDVYSLSMTLWLLLTGRSPYEGKTRDELRAAKLEHPLPDLRQVRRGTPDSFVMLLERGLDRDVTRRPTMAMLARGLRLHAGALDLSLAPSFAPTSTELRQGGSMSHPSALSGSSIASLPVALSEPAPSQPSMLLSAVASIERHRRPIRAAALICSIIVMLSLACWLVIGKSTTALPAEPNVQRQPLTQLNANDMQSIAARMNWGDKNPVLMRGKVTSVELGSAGYIRFDASDLVVEFSPDLASDMERRFGGVHGTELIGKRVSVEGRLTGSPKQPVIQISNVEQVTLVRATMPPKSPP